MTPQEQEQMDFLAFKCRVYEDQIEELGREVNRERREKEEALSDLDSAELKITLLNHIIANPAPAGGGSR